MKVDKKIGTPVKSDSAAAVKSSLTSSAKKTKGADILGDLGSTSARVDLSERAQDVKKATEIARKGMNDVDEAKVQKYQALIDAGKYQVDSSKVADRLLEEQLMNEAVGEAKN